MTTGVHQKVGKIANNVMDGGVKGVIEGVAQKISQIADYTMEGSDNYIGLSEDQKRVKRRILMNGAEFQVIPHGGDIMNNGIQMDNHFNNNESATQQEAFHKILRPLLAQKAKAEAEKVEAEVKKTEAETKAVEGKEKRKTKKTEAEVKAIEAESEARVKAIEAESEARVKVIEAESEAQLIKLQD